MEILSVLSCALSLHIFHCNLPVHLLLASFVLLHVEACNFVRSNSFDGDGRPCLVPRCNSQYTESNPAKEKWGACLVQGAHMVQTSQSANVKRSQENVLLRAFRHPRKNYAAAALKPGKAKALERAPRTFKRRPMNLSSSATTT